MLDLDFRILGALEAQRGRQELALGGGKQRALLGRLLIEPNRGVATDSIIEALWTEDRPGKPLTAIQGYISQLRKLLAPDHADELIVTEPTGYRLALAREQIDLGRFEDLLQSGRAALTRGDLAAAAEQLSQGLRLFRGSPLADFTYEEWARSEIERIAELRLACLEERIEADLALGRHAELVGELEALTSAHPLRERLRGQLMLALYRAGRQAEALDAYQATRTLLVEELGLEPGAPVQELHRRILLQDPELDLPRADPTETSSTTVRSNLPLAVSSFLGREAEVNTVREHLTDGETRLLTLTGPGGTGKNGSH